MTTFLEYTTCMAKLIIVISLLEFLNVIILIVIIFNSIVIHKFKVAVFYKFQSNFVNVFIILYLACLKDVVKDGLIFSNKKNYLPPL